MSTWIDSRLKEGWCTEKVASEQTYNKGVRQADPCMRGSSVSAERISF